MRHRSNITIVFVSLAIVGGMLGLSFAAVPLYDAFCRITGYGGTTQVADKASEEVVDRVVTVRFNADVQSKLGWRFRPEQRAIDVRVGENALAYYAAENVTDSPLVGQATYNVTPAKAGIYFNKIDCFCFEQQFLNPGERVDMPVSFFVDPEFAADPDMADVNTITLSYTFFNSGEEALEEYLEAHPDAIAASAESDQPETSEGS